MKDMPNPNLFYLTKGEAEFVICALNAYWNQSRERLNEKNLGDIEKENLKYNLKTSKEMMKKLGAFD